MARMSVRMSVSDADIKGVDDLLHLSNLSVDVILENLRQRYERDVIYTNAADVLIAVNPFKSLGISGQETYEQYQTMDLTRLPPHIYATAKRCVTGLVQNNANYSLLVSGESGAGKTETTKLLLFFCANSLIHDAAVIDVITELDPILESFGNAKTERNNNSSRFGKWLELCQDPNTKTITSMSLSPFLLEATRICDQGQKERNYHIFYQLIQDVELCRRFKLTDARSSKYLAKSEFTCPSIDDEKGMRDLKRSLTRLFTPDLQMAVFKVIAGILHLGRVNFTEDDSKAFVEDNTALLLAAELLDIEPAVLDKALLERIIAASGDEFHCPNTKPQAETTCDNLAKLLYRLLFDFLNEAFTQEMSKVIWSCQKHADQKPAKDPEVASVDSGLSAFVEDTTSNFLGILDIPGFEIFEKNKLEQLLINFANEKLQQHFTKAVFKLEIDAYERDGVKVASIEFRDNRDIIALLEEAKGGLFSLLDDATLGVKQTDEGLTRRFEKIQNSNFLKAPFGGNSFGVNHYAGTVWYDTTGFLQKNTSSIALELAELVKSSTNEVLMNAKVQNPKKATAHTNFKKSLAKLLKKVDSSTCTFIRCIKPNKDKQPGVFDEPYVEQQLATGGVSETIKIRKAGYLSRFPFQTFTKRYNCLIKSSDRKEVMKLLNASSNDGARNAAIALVKYLGFTSDDLTLGKTMVFTRAAASARLDAAVLAKKAESTATIGRMVHRWLEARESKKTKWYISELATVTDNIENFFQFPKPANVAVDFVQQEADKINDLIHGFTVKWKPRDQMVQKQFVCEAEITVSLMGMIHQVDANRMDGFLKLPGFDTENVRKVRRVLEERLVSLQKEAAHHQAFKRFVEPQSVMDRNMYDEINKLIPEMEAWQQYNFGFLNRDVDRDWQTCLQRKNAFESTMEEIRLKCQEALLTTNSPEVSEAIAMVSLCHMETPEKEETVDKLTGRLRVLEEQNEIKVALVSCLASQSLNVVQEAIQRTEKAGLDTLESWLLPEGHRQLEIVRTHLAKLLAKPPAQNVTPPTSSTDSRLTSSSNSLAVVMLGKKPMASILKTKGEKGKADNTSASVTFRPACVRRFEICDQEYEDPDSDEEYEESLQGEWIDSLPRVWEDGEVGEELDGAIIFLRKEKANSEVASSEDVAPSQGNKVEIPVPANQGKINKVPAKSSLGPCLKTGSKSKAAKSKSVVLVDRPTIREFPVCNDEWFSDGEEEDQTEATTSTEKKVSMPQAGPDSAAKDQTEATTSTEKKVSMPQAGPDSAAKDSDSEGKPILPQMLLQASPLAATKKSPPTLGGTPPVSCLRKAGDGKKQKQVAFQSEEAIINTFIVVPSEWEDVNEEGEKDAAGKAGANGFQDPTMNATCTISEPDPEPNACAEGGDANGETTPDPADLVTFSRIQDVNSWSGGGKSYKTQKELMTTWSRQEIASPLTKVPGYMKTSAVANHVDLLRVMGDVGWTRSLVAEEEPILKRVMMGPLTDEVFFQIMKQLNKNPGADSKARGWQLLNDILVLIKPSDELLVILGAFAAREAENIGTEDVSPGTESKTTSLQTLIASVAQTAKASADQTN